MSNYWFSPAPKCLLIMHTKHYYMGTGVGVYGYISIAEYSQVHFWF